MSTPEQNQIAVAKITEFLREIGLTVESGMVEETTFLPGIRVVAGGLVYDPARLKYPGDLLHEAGHLAVKPPAERSQANCDMGADPAEEMTAIAWSYAAILRLQLPPEVVFHPDGYCGGSQSILENFRAGRWFGVPMLQWLELCWDEKRAPEMGAAPYPQMIKWLRTT